MKRLLVATLLATGCASAHQELRPPSFIPGLAQLQFAVSPSHCLKPCIATLKAIVIAPNELCVTGVKWIFDDGRFGGEKGVWDQPVLDCFARRFIIQRRYKTGSHWISVEILSDDTKLPAKGIQLDVNGGEEEIQ